MNLRTLLTAARTAGWQHVTYDGSFGCEHTWQLDDTAIGLEPRVAHDGGTYLLLTIYRDGTQLVAGRVESVDQAVALLAAYGLINCPHRERLARVLAGVQAINQAGADAVTASHRRLLALHATNGTPIGGAL